MHNAEVVSKEARYRQLLLIRKEINSPAYQGYKAGVKKNVNNW